MTIFFFGMPLNTDDPKKFQRRLQACWTLELGEYGDKKDHPVDHAVLQRLMNLLPVLDTYSIRTFAFFETNASRYGRNILGWPEKKYIVS